ncbi:aldehyde ferredoxin oxidoreductase [Rhizocola hellebori]|uniref:Aldehyde ferredoxin oxidoreductase n=1 Tax=Rhizocola hellebori TaxID=1392758 RepID=A0A8J3QFP0_9ACTN|nr:aldehyde ferredoxin oxidoreductase C-terminal domain-containing protein [Rhizocola hellebori]GIH09167.1 aldehyde ferredoxin oxidoreductase [Rhizocola hellebori]
MSVYLHLDLSSGRQATEPVTGWGGPLLALHHLRKALAHAEPVPVAFVTSVVAGLGGVGLARCAAVGVSPLSGAVAETRAEGPFAAGLRASGVVGVGLTGAAGSPSYVVVDSGRASIHPATELWGLGTGEATGILLDRHGPDAAVAVIGPAGEAGARYANVVTCRSFPLPRLGFGAILGARNIKAIVCVPGEPPPPADPAALSALTSAYAAQMPSHGLAGWQHAVPGFGAWPGEVTEPGRASVRNFADTGTAPAEWPGLAPAHFAPSLTWSAGGCPGCPNDCIKGYAGAGLHQEAVAMLGPNLGIGDLAAILAANARCQELGLDPVSLGGTLGYLLETGQLAPPGQHAAAVVAGAEFGAVAGETGGGQPERWLLEAIELAAQPGHPFGQGAAALAQRHGRPEAAMVSRGVELPPFDPRVQRGLGLMYAANPIGPRYDAIEHDLDFDPVYGLEFCYEESRRIGLTVPNPASQLDFARTVVLADLWSGLDALLVCPYASTPTRPLSLDGVCALVEAVTGVAIAPQQVLALGRERLAQQQQINDLLGVAAGRLPDRFFDEPVQAGVFAGAVLDRTEFEAAVLALQQLWRG